MTALNAHLTRLESAGLISLADAGPELEYLFRHALVQEAAYDSLLKSERRDLHRAAGEALESLYPDRSGELAPRLAEHFWQAGETEKALRYFLTAAENAARGYANPEAISLYTRALRAAGADLLSRAAILRERGRLFETTGDFDRALADDEASLEAARAAGDLDSEWQSLIRLGFLWSSRSYQETGEYYRQALDLARRLDDPRSLAHSLNWLGNFEINAEQPIPSRGHHEEALQIFTGLQDTAGIAETNDLLGISLTIGGDLVQAGLALGRARDLYTQLGERLGLSSVLVVRSLLGGETQTDIVVHPPVSLEESRQSAEQGLQLAADAGWRSGVVFALSCLGSCQVAAGDYGQALESTRQALTLAREIQHRQWEIMASLAAGDAHTDILDLEEGEAHLRRGLSLGIESSSIHWIHSMTGHLARNLLVRGKLEEAQTLIDQYVPADLPMQSLGQRLSWCARALLALRQGDPSAALSILAKLE
ncbi:MAG TPA: hypothetical protein VF813_03265, partial [Anaerolineaceae bacterium]